MQLAACYRVPCDFLARGFLYKYPCYKEVGTLLQIAHFRFLLNRLVLTLRIVVLISQNDDFQFGLTAMSKARHL